MGKGDKRTRRGKIFAGSYGKTRPKSTKKNETADTGEDNKKKKKSS
jgi:30S ribosomal protein S31